MPAPSFDLYLVMECAVGDRPAADVLREIVRGLGSASGRLGLELRDKSADARELYRTGGKIRDVARPAGVSFLVNDRIDVALSLGADGAHLGGGSIRADDARLLLGGEKLIGLSAHSVEEARRGLDLGADFIALGPLFFTPSKARYGDPLGLGPLKKLAAEGFPLPIYGLGGVNEGNAAEVTAGGARGVAMIRGVLAAPDPSGAARRVLEAVDAGRGRRNIS